jgi:hypothetical protein
MENCPAVVVDNYPARRPMIKWGLINPLISQGVIDIGYRGDSDFFVPKEIRYLTEFVFPPVENYRP